MINIILYSIVSYIIGSISGSLLLGKFKNIDIKYAWPFDMDTFALFLATHVKVHDHLSAVANN